MSLTIGYMQDIRDTIRFSIQLAEIGIFSLALFLFVWGAIYITKPFILYFKTNKKIQRYLIILIILILFFFFVFLFFLDFSILFLLIPVIFFAGLKILIDFQCSLKDNPKLKKKVSLMIISCLVFFVCFVIYFIQSYTLCCGGSPKDF